MAVVVRRDVHTPTGVITTSITDAVFRSYVQAVEQMLLDAGFTVAADTGQIDPATVTWPASGYAGFRVYAMSDDLHATSPLYMKVRYGRVSSTASASYTYTLRFEFGTGTDGAGTLTPALDDTGSGYYLATGNSGTVPIDSYANGDDAEGWRWGALRINNQGTGQLTVMVERTRNPDAPAVPTGDGVRLVIGGAAFSSTTSAPDLRTRQLDFTDSLAWPSSGNFDQNYIVPYNTSANMYATTAYSSSVIVFPVWWQRREGFVPLRGAVWSGTGWTDSSPGVVTMTDGKVRSALGLRCCSTTNIGGYPVFVVD